ncbi:AAA family ATPase [Hokovirus HKV1]|uniref:AAA family ATPase n=1 Tax=Hokovirus HKV1 TaxID=1977638 RepID=A0A1V0SG63_9VIRU|nr:AAA family ATPase [Hokovirus HKV1]
MNRDLIIKKLPKPDLAYGNCCFICGFNPEDKYIINLVNSNTIYPLIHINDQNYQEIYMSDVIRSHHKLQLNDSLKIQILNKPVDKFINYIKLHILRKKFRVADDQIINLHEKDVKEKIKTNLKNHYFSMDQICVIKINDVIYTLTVVKINGDGNLNNKTVIELETNDLEINLIDEKILKKELFQDDFDFSSIGIGGLSNEMITIFRESLCTRAYKPEIIEKLGIKHVKGILLYGPPGTGKTLIARNISKIISPQEPIIINGPELLSKYVGASEENIRKVFLNAENDYKKNMQKSMLHVIVFDEIDAICKTRGSSGSRTDVTDSMVNQLLTKIDGYEELPNIFIIAMTNRKDLLDPALLRPGRIEKHIKIGFPDKKGRQEIFLIHTTKMRLHGMLNENVNFETCADLTENFSGSEIEAVVKCASSLTLHELINKKNCSMKNIEKNISINMEHFLTAINIFDSNNNAKKFISKHLLPNFKILNEEYEKAINSLNDFINYDNEKRLNTVLLFGDNKCGKTTLASYIANIKKVKCTKFLSAIDFVNKSDSQKNEILVNTLFDTHLSDQSLLILDDIDIIINYAKFDYSINYSNSIFQTLKTILKTVPDNINNKIVIMCICSELSLKSAIENLFDLIIEL